jgi:hypothetical protein
MNVPEKNKTRTNLFLDIAILLALILAMTPRATGIPIHEWLSLAFALAVVVHLALHWEWIVGVAPRFFVQLFHESRLNFVVDLVFFLSMLIIMVSGIAISKAALPALGISPPFSLVWKQAHRISADVALITFGIHCGLHAKWIGQSCKRYAIDPIVGLFKKPAATKGIEGGKA